LRAKNASRGRERQRIKKVNIKRNIFLQHVVFQARQATRNPATTFFVRFCAPELSQPIYLYSVKSKTILHESAPICTNWHQLARIGPNWAVSARSGTFWAVPGRSVPFRADRGRREGDSCPVSLYKFWDDLAPANGVECNRETPVNQPIHK
jgi:hypothetical protein